MNCQEGIIASPKVPAENLLSRAPAWAVEFILDLLAGGWSEAVRYYRTTPD
jgi:hypothetical protein